MGFPLSTHMQKDTVSNYRILYYYFFFAVTSQHFVEPLVLSVSDFELITPIGFKARMDAPSPALDASNKYLDCPGQVRTMNLPHVERRRQVRTINLSHVERRRYPFGHPARRSYRIFYILSSLGHCETVLF